MVMTLLRPRARSARRQSHFAQRNTPPRLEALESRLLLSTGLQPTAQEQLLLQQLNAIRADPAAYGQSIGLNLSNVAPSQPLAFNTLLEASAQAHSQDMNDQNYFGHVAPNGQDPGDRMTAAGFNWDEWGESIAAGFPDSASALQALIVDKGVPDLGHRIQLLAMSSLFQGQNQVGIGIVSGSGTYGTYYTIDTAQASGDSNAFLTGVVFNDANHNGQYAIGEGLGGVTVTASNGATTTTFGSGGYSLELAPGTYSVTFSGGGLNAPVVQTVTIGSENVGLNITNPTAPPPHPTLASIADQTVANGSNSLQVALDASDSAGLPLTYQVSVLGSNPAYALEQQLNLQVPAGGYYQNVAGYNEKWLRGPSSDAGYQGWYAIMPNGDIDPLLSNGSIGAPIANFGSAVWANPLLLVNAAPTPASAGVSASVSNNVLTLTGLQGYTGSLQVNVSASDGVGSATQSFTVNVTPPSLTLAPIANVTAAHGSPVQVTLDPEDIGNNPVTYQVQVTGNSSAYNLEQQLNLSSTGKLYQNTLGMNEKWLQSSTSNLANDGWYVVLPDGEVCPWLGGNNIGSSVAKLSSSVWNDPSLLYKAAAPTYNSSFNGNVLTLAPPGNYVGTLTVTVSATEGSATTSQQFTVTLT